VPFENKLPFLSWFQKNSLSLFPNQVPNHLQVTGIKWEFGVNPKLSPQL